MLTMAHPSSRLDGPDQSTSWCTQLTPKHPTCQERGHDASILLRTGPGAWSKAVHAYMATINTEPEDYLGGRQVADLVVLPQVAFGCNSR